jgi:hypothetical protein
LTVLKIKKIAPGGDRTKDLWIPPWLGALAPVVWLLNEISSSLH